MFGLENRVRYQLAGVFVLESVENARALLPRRDEAGKAKFGKVLRHCRRRPVGNFGQLAHRKLAVAKGQDQANAGRVSKHREYFDSEFHVLAVGLTPANLLICIHTQIITQGLIVTHDQTGQLATVYL
jgi:hypothetical protein